jgi:hypothetical protein
MTTQTTPLPEALHERMLKWATDNPTDPRATEMANLGVKLENVLNPMGTPPQVVGAWARARKFWCQVTGEDLI